MPTESFKSILLFKLRYIGDVLLTTPAIRLLRESYPEARITMVVNGGTEDVLRYNPHVNRVLTMDRERIEGGRGRRLSYEWQFLRTLREDRYDLSVDFNSGERGAFLALLAGAGLRIGFRYRKGLRRMIFHRQVSPEGRLHTVERNLMLVEKALRLTRRNEGLELPLGPEEERRTAVLLKRHRLSGENLVVLHPGGRHWFKRWPAAHWARLADILQGEFRLPVVITGGGGDREEGRAIVSRMRTPVRSLVGELSLLELAALIRRATLFIGNDSGPSHVAAAVGTSVIALFGPSDPAVWRPWGEGHVVISRQPSCSPCGHGLCDFSGGNCMERIDVEEVLRAVSQCLERPLPPTLRRYGSSSIEA